MFGLAKQSDVDYLKKELNELREKYWQLERESVYQDADSIWLGFVGTEPRQKITLKQAVMAIVSNLNLDFKVVRKSENVVAIPQPPAKKK